MRALLTSVAHERFGAELSRPGVDWLVMAGDGSLVSGDGQAVAREEADAQVAWGTSDLYTEGAPVRAFFGLLRRAPGLRWYQSPAAGYDTPMYSELVARGVRVTNAHVNSIPIAEYVMRSVLDEFQLAERWRRLAAGREWRIHDWREVSGTTWLIIGLGSIGGEVARRARAFGATMIGCRRHPSATDPADRMVTPDQLSEVTGGADVIVLAAPASSATTNLVDAAFLDGIKPGCVLVNVARGALVDEDALLAGLDRGRPGVAVLDAFRTEPLPPDHPFWSHPAVRVTPHNAAGGTGRHERQAELFGANLDRYLAGRPLENDVTEAIAAG